MRIHTCLFGSWLVLFGGLSLVALPGCGSSNGGGGSPEDAAIRSDGTAGTSVMGGGPPAGGGATAGGGASVLTTSAAGASASAGTTAVAGQTATGGRSNTSMAGGTATNGSTVTASMGGTNATGGTTGVLAGKTATGGAGGIGGTVTGGNSATGGILTGGSSATGGILTGGSSATGGILTGGSSATGGVGGTGGKGDAGVVGEYGFSYRSPTARQVSCFEPGRDAPYVTEETDPDWLCTFHGAGVSGYVYVQSNPTGLDCSTDTFMTTYQTQLAQISINGQVSDLGNAQLDYGGKHHGDNLLFDYQGKTYKYYHSSITFAYRPCQPMDCLVVYSAGSTTNPEIDGCTSARTLPEVCVAIKKDGTHAALSPDPFRKCSGDPNP